MSTNSDARRVDTEDRDPYDAESVRNDPWASGPGQLSQDEQETERFVPEQRDGQHDSAHDAAHDAAHDGHVYASDTYAEPETEVLPSDEPTAVGVARVDGSEEPTAVVHHSTDSTDSSDDVDARTDVAADEAEESAVAAEEAREDAEAEQAEAAREHEDKTFDYHASTDTDSGSRPEPIVETVPLAAAEPVAVVTPAHDDTVHAEPVYHEPADADVVDAEVVEDGPVAAEPFGEPVAADPEVGTDDLVAVPVAVADEPAAASNGELKPGDVPVEPVAGFFAADAVAGLRDRWREAQLGFVDDPRQAVDDVKALVNEAVDQFTASLSAQRDELNATAGEDTEQYRVAVQRYRSFFDRLLGL